MMKRILLPAVLGFLVLTVWTSVVNGMYGFNARLTLTPVPDHDAVYEMLKERVVDGGVYIANPRVEPGVGFPPGEPVFTVMYSGFGHEGAARMQRVKQAVAFLSMVLAAALLAVAGPKVRSRYVFRVLFVLGLGVLLALVGDVPRMDIGGQPERTALLFAANRVALWTLVALTMAWATGRGSPTPAD